MRPVRAHGQEEQGPLVAEVHTLDRSPRSGVRDRTALPWLAEVSPQVPGDLRRRRVEKRHVVRALPFPRRRRQLLFGDPHVVGLQRPPYHGEAVPVLLTRPAPQGRGVVPPHDGDGRSSSTGRRLPLPSAYMRLLRKRGRTLQLQVHAHVLECDVSPEHPGVTHQKQKPRVGRVRHDRGYDDGAGRPRRRCCGVSSSALRREGPIGEGHVGVRASGLVGRRRRHARGVELCRCKRTIVQTVDGRVELPAHFHGEIARASPTAHLPRTGTRALSLLPLQEVVSVFRLFLHVKLRLADVLYILPQPDRRREARVRGRLVVAQDRASEGGLFGLLLSLSLGLLDGRGKVDRSTDLLRVDVPQKQKTVLGGRDQEPT
mmetsp:Transcript_19618/g.49273  ORF Transcript_19618/g.49273 Transcript_19618/m.49273 type:complete len:373 (+) Transcript_19618:1972-3090(+)